MGKKMDKPKFTQEQENWISYIISEWYEKWREEIEPPFGYAMQELKQTMINDMEYHYWKQFEKPISLKDRKKLSPDCIKEFLENPEIINKFEPK